MKPFALAALSAAFAFAQISMPLKKGVAVATCFSGWKTQAPNWTIDLDGPVVGLVDVRDRTAGVNPGTGTNWQPSMFHNDNAAAAHQWTARRLGQVFGIAIDKQGNIFVAASRAYGAQGAVTETGAGLWGPGGSGAIYRIDGDTGDVSNFITTNNAAVYTTAGGNGNKMPNTGPGLGNLAYDAPHDQLLVTNFEDGKIYRIGNLSQASGTIVGAPFDPFDADDGSTGFADPGLLAGNGTQIGERLWGIGVFKGRAYFSVWQEDLARLNRGLSNAVYSVAINATGALVGSTIRKEFDAINYQGFSAAPPVSDIEFSSGGKMLLAERGQVVGHPDGQKDLVIPPVPNSLAAHRARAFEYELTGNISSTYLPLLNPLWVGTYAPNTNSAGGVDYGYLEYDAEKDQLEGCEKMIWATGDFLHSVNAPGSVIYGLQGTVYGVNTKGTGDDYFVDLNGTLGVQDKTQIGDVDVFRDPCGPEGASGVTSGYLECVTEGTGQYNFVVTVANNHASDAYGAVILLPNGATTNLTFNPPLGPGATTTVTIPVTLGYQPTGTLLNFVFQFHGKVLPPPFEYEWCDTPVTVPIRVPECGCLTATLVRRGPAANSYILYIKNHVVDPVSTFATIDIKTAGLTITPTSSSIQIPYGTTQGIPVTITPAPAAGTFVRIAVALHGKKLGNGYYENCCMEEMDMPIPRLVISDGAGVFGNVFADTNRNLQLDLREQRLAGVRVTMRPSSGEPQETRTSESGEYYFPLREDVTGPITVTVQSPEGFAAIRPSVRVFEKVQRLSNVVEGANFPMAAVSTQIGGGQVGSAGAPVSLELEPVDGIGGGGSSAIRYSVPEGMATLRLLDEEGRQVAMLYDAYHVAGAHVHTLREHHVPAGFFTLELAAGEERRQQFVYVAPMEPEGTRSLKPVSGVRLFTRRVQE